MVSSPGAMGVDSGDYDRSGRPHLLVGNFSNQMLGLYHNEGTGLFVDEAPAPTGLAASSVTQTALTLRWVAATDNVGVSGYNIYRGGTLLGTTTTLTYPISGLTCGTSSTFTVESREDLHVISPPPVRPTGMSSPSPNSHSHTARAEPSSREAFEDRGDHAPHGLVGMQQDLAVLVAPHQPGGQAPA